MTNVLTPTPKQQFSTNNGAPAVGYKLFTYQAGSSTKLATYKDPSNVSPNTNPILMDFRGECNLWVPPNIAYKYVFALPTDTDPPGNPIWSVDNLVNSQLLTLYGGIDTGGINAYVLNFVANFTAYADGIVIYWIPSGTNTAASTINVNGLGPVPIKNADGSDLVSNQLVANQVVQIIYKGTGFILFGSQQSFGTFLGTLTGVTTLVQANIQWAITGRVASLTFPATLQGTSNNTACLITGMPSFLQPSTTKKVAMPNYSMQNNSAVDPNTVDCLMSQVTTDIQFNRGGLAAGWTAAGLKGVFTTFCITYPLS